MYYSLIVSGNEQQWDRCPTPFPLERLFEYTPEFVKEEFRADAEIADKIKKYPALLVYETIHEKPARLCQITEIEYSDGDAYISFEVISDFNLTNEELSERAFQLGIEDFEFHRTHWAIKKIDLLSSLESLSLAHEGQLLEFAKRFPDYSPVDESDGEAAERPSIFVSYAHVDKKYLDRIQVHLKPIERRFDITLWDDTKLRAGDEWKEEIKKEIENCAAAILIVSADFLASDFIITEELPPLLEAAKKRGARIIPIIAKPCLFAEIDELSKFQAINSPSKTLISMTEAEAEEAYLRLASTIKTLA